MDQNAKLQVEYRSLNDLTPFARNARTHTSAQIDQLASSLREFGFTNPILIDENNTIIAGHGRVLAAHKLKLERVPTISLQHLTETQRKAYSIADNQHALNSTWDYGILSEELEELTGFSFDLSALGFDDAKYAQTLSFGEEGNDLNELWQDMPEFVQEKQGFRKIVVHFHDQEGVDQFAKILETELPENKKFLWYPDVEIRHVADKRYRSES